MTIDGWTLALQTINVAVLIWILSRFLFRPISNIISERQASAQKLLDDAAGRRAEAAAALRQAQDEARRQVEARDAQLAAARTEADAAARAMLEQTRADAARLMEDARLEAERLAQTRRESSERQAARLAVDIASKLLERLPPKALLDSFADGLCEGLAALPESARGELVAQAPARLRVNRALSEGEEARVAAAVERALGRRIPFEVVVDPEVIAGFELETAHARVANSFREDLRRIGEELSREPR